MDWGGLTESRWQTKPREPVGLVWGVDREPVRPGVGRERGEGFWAGVIAVSISSHEHLNVVGHGQRMKG